MGKKEACGEEPGKWGVANMAIMVYPAEVEVVQLGKAGESYCRCLEVE